MLSSLSFKLDPGEVLLISGKSGCGKSTLVKIILGLLPPTGGHIICNGVNILEHNIQSFRKITGTVLQGDSLLSGSLLYNISFDNTVSLDDVIHITKGLGIHEVINSLPMGYYSPVTDINAFCRLVRYSVFYLPWLYTENQLCLSLMKQRVILTMNLKHKLLIISPLYPVQRLL